MARGDARCRPGARTDLASREEATMSWWSRLTNVLLRSDRLQQDLEDEQRFHIEARADDARGARPVASGRARAGVAAVRPSPAPARVEPRREAHDLGRVPGARPSSRVATAPQGCGRVVGRSPLARARHRRVHGRLLADRRAHPAGIAGPRSAASRVSRPQRCRKADDQRFSAIFSYPFFDRVRQTSSPHMEAFSMSQQSLRQAVLPDAGGVEEKLRTQFVSGNAFDALGVTAAHRTRAGSIGRCDAGWASGRGGQPCILDTPARRQSTRARAVDSDSSRSRTRSSAWRRPDSPAPSRRADGYLDP